MADCSLIVEYPSLLRHRGELRQQACARRKRLLVGVPLVLVISLGLLWLSPPLGLLTGAVGTGVLFFLALPGSSTVDAGELSGIEGEIAVLRQLETLPDEFLLFNRVKLPDEMLTNGFRELDFIVAGPTGLWVIEVKNTPGHIHVRPDERQWPLARRSCGSAPSWNALRNPIPQAQAQVDALGRWLLRHGVNLKPQPMVVLAHPETALIDADQSQVPVLVCGQVADTVRQHDPVRVPPRLVPVLSRLR